MILGQILVEMEDSDKISEIFRWKVGRVNLNQVSEGTLDTRPTPVGSWKRIPAANRHKCQFKRVVVGLVSGRWIE